MTDVEKCKRCGQWCNSDELDENGHCVTCELDRPMDSLYYTDDDIDDTDAYPERDI